MVTDQNSKMKRPASHGRDVQVRRQQCMRFTTAHKRESSALPQRAAMYIVISKPKRKSWAVGVCQVIGVS
jgi:hypothetical protein